MWWLIILVGFILGVVLPLTLKGRKKLSCGCDCAVCQLRPTVMRLFADHTIWTRQVVVSAFAELPDLTANLARLKQNQTDIALAISHKFESSPGPVFRSQKKLWDEHIDLAVDVVTAVISNSAGDLKQFQAQWYENANEIADSLSALQPKVWPRQVLRDMMKEHLDTLTDEVIARSKKQWMTGIQKQDDVLTHILRMAEAITKGLA